MSGIACETGCCPGCGKCYGYSIGCHTDPCKCGATDTPEQPEGETRNG